MPISDQLLPRGQLAWRMDIDEAALAALDPLAPDGIWDGPIIISMPRTGSTLLGTLFLLLHDRDGEQVYRRYIHEPVAPLFWEGKPIESILGVIDGPLTERDIIQESAYQFASKTIARWFLERARKPIAFVMRHPQLSWPSRWRIMLRQWLAANPGAPDAGRWEAALETNDFTTIGDVLTTKVIQTDNGWFSFLSLINLCQAEAVEHIIIDNARLRADPDQILTQLCERWCNEYDEAMTTWADLSEAKPRVVMSDLAAGPEYDWYYAATLNSTEGIVREDQEPLGLEHFPQVLRGRSDEHLTIDGAVDWYETLLARPETLV